MVVIYVSEIAHASYRQVLLSLNSVFFSVGVLFATTVGSLFKWQLVNIIFLIFTAVITVLLVVFLPESPIWLAKFRASRVYEARSSLKRIYPINDQVSFYIFSAYLIKSRSFECMFVNTKSLVKNITLKL